MDKRYENYTSPYSVLKRQSAVGEAVRIKNCTCYKRRNKLKNCRKTNIGHIENAKYINASLDKLKYKTSWAVLSAPPGPEPALSYY